MIADLRLVVVTDDGLAHPRGVEDLVRECLAAGAPAVQLRDKRSDDARLLERAVAMRALCREHGALFFVNDRLDIALASGADGVHLGPDDLPPAAARRIAPDGFLIGISARDVEGVAGARADGADYAGCGPVFGTSTKEDAPSEPLGLEALARLVGASSVPVVAIGGITGANARSVRDTGAAGVAVARGVMTAPDPGAVVRELLTDIDRVDLSRRSRPRSGAW